MGRYLSQSFTSLHLFSTQRPSIADIFDMCTDQGGRLPQTCSGIFSRLTSILTGQLTLPCKMVFLPRHCMSPIFSTRPILTPSSQSLQRIDIIPDVEDDIIEAVRRLSHNYDIVVTSGGIGPTHDDITYESIAKAFHLPLVLHGEAYSLMKKKTAEHRDPVRAAFNFDVPSKELDGKKKMILLPHDSSRPVEDQAILACRDKYWVPVSVVNGNVYILPGIPELCTHRPVLFSRHSCTN